MVLPDSIPLELRVERRWVITRNKSPYNARTGAQASVTDPTTWSGFSEALNAYERNLWDGIGYVLGAGVCGLDLDSVRDAATGAIEPWAQDAINILDTYSELSPSQTGIHVLFRAELPPGRRQKELADRRHHGFGIYDDGRYFQMTGQQIAGNGVVSSRQAELEQVYARLFPPEPEANHAPCAPNDLPDLELLERAMAAKNGPKFSKLWAGEWEGDYASQSEADLALLTLLAFWTGRDNARMANLFCRSGLYREAKGVKYINRSIRAAIEKTTETWSAPGPEPRCGTGTTESPDWVTDDFTDLDGLIEIFRKWLHLPDAGALEIVLGAIAANRMAGDPLWLLLVGSPGIGKTEILQSSYGLPDIHMAATLTEAALLSGTPDKDKAAGSKGGLLRAIGDFGILILKDFTSILSMHRESRGAMLAALREIFDGSWTRHVGVDGGKSLHWEGKLALIGGCTPAVDSHHAVMASMGERFLFFRLSQIEADNQVKRALKHMGREKAMRAELSAAVAGFFKSLTLPAERSELSDKELEWLIALSTLVVKCRSSVERDSYSREIELIPESEAPARLAITLSQLLAGLKAIGVGQKRRIQLVTKTALDSIPSIRRKVFEHMVTEKRTLSTTDIATAVGYPTTTTRRALEDLTCHGLMERESTGPGNPDQWKVGDWARERYEALSTVPEKSVGI